jgi:hypothetical protein
MTGSMRRCETEDAAAKVLARDDSIESADLTRDEAAMEPGFGLQIGRVA